MQARCPKCGASIIVEGETAACHECHSVFSAAEAVPLAPSSTLEYFGERPAKAAEGSAFSSGAVLVAVEFVVGAVALGMTVGLTEPGPMLRQLGACGVFLGGAVGAVVGLFAIIKKRLGYVDRALALTTVAVGGLCIAAGVVIFTGWKG